jgi:quercetin dioxygenase-like cupin family protein
MNRFLIGVVMLLVLAAGCGRKPSETGADPLPAPIQFQAGSIEWQDAPPALPPGTQLAVLEGDPKTDRLFTLRVKVPAGARLEPHWHSRDERVTVLYGRVGVGFSERYQESDLKYFVGGSYYVNPAQSRHYLFFPMETVVQITGIGPWETHFVQAGDKP